MFRNINTKNRALITSMLASVLFFILVSPVKTRTFEFLFAPREIRNIKVTQKNTEITLVWDKNQENDIKNYLLNISSKGSFYLDKTVDNYLITGLVNGTDYSISLSAVDTLNKKSKEVTFTSTPSAGDNSFIVNQQAKEGRLKTIIPITFFISALTFVLNIWVLFFRSSRKTVLSISAFPSVTLIPYLVLTNSFVLAINQEVNKLIFSFIAAGGLLILTYLLILTSNILNTSRYVSIPLEQAGKASQFIFALISSYLMLIFAFSTNLNLVERVVVVLPFVLYFSYSTISCLKDLAEDQIVIRSISITLIIFLSLVVLSIWPLPSVYSMLTAAVIFYILLNIALEIRGKLSKYIWVEFSTLIILITVLLLTNSVWGINGNMV